MDMDDDDDFLYGAQSPVPITSTSAPQESTPTPVPTSSISASMAASLAAYGIDPKAAVAAAPIEEPIPDPEDGGVEEDDLEQNDEEEDEDDSEDEDDVKWIFSGQASRLDLRKPQQQTSNVIGIGKWAHTATGKEQPPAASPIPTPQKASASIPGQTTEYTPTSRPGTHPSPLPSTTQNPPIPAGGEAPTLQPAPASNVNTNNGISLLPQSSLPPVSAPATYPKIDASNPTGIIPSSGQSVYELDVSVFEGSGQPWRRPGSDLQDWFNFGFDEGSFGKFLRFRGEMERGVAALNTLPMGQMPPQVADLLHLQNTMQMPNMNMNMNMNMMQNGNMMPFNPQQMQTMQQMMMQGMDPMMVMQQMGMGGMMGANQGQIQNMNMGGQARIPTVPRPSATPMPGPTGSQSGLEAGEEVKQEDGEAGVDNGADSQITTAAVRGRGLVPGVRGAVGGRGAAARGRGAIPLGPRAGVVLPANIPKGPKAARAFKDKDRVGADSSTSAALDYGAHTPSEGGESGSVTGSRSPGPRSRAGRRREKSFSSDYSEDSEEYERDRRSKEKEKEKEKERERERERKGREREKRKRDDGTASGAVLGPGGWESGQEEEVRRSRRRKSASGEEERHKSSRRRK